MFYTVRVMVFSATFNNSINYTVAVSFIGGRNWCSIVLISLI